MAVMADVTFVNGNAYMIILASKLKLVTAEQIPSWAPGLLSKR